MLVMVMGLVGGNSVGLSGLEAVSGERIQIDRLAKIGFSIGFW